MHAVTSLPARRLALNVLDRLIRPLAPDELDFLRGSQVPKRALNARSALRQHSVTTQFRCGVVRRRVRLSQSIVRSLMTSAISNTSHSGLKPLLSD